MLNLFTITTDAFFLNDCPTNLLPSFFFPLIAKKMSPFLTSLELIVALPSEIFDYNLLNPDSSLIKFNLILFDKLKFLILMDSKIIFLSEK